MNSERIEIARAGGPEVLALRSWRVPRPGAGEVVVQVAHAGVSFGDVMLRRHVFRRVPRPAVPGYDVVGAIVDANGTGLAVGARVGAYVEYGGYARHAIVPAAALVPVPAALDGAAVAAAILNYATAAAMLARAAVPAGEAILVHGIRGGVGSAVADLARGRGLVVLGTARGGAPTADRDVFDAADPALAARVRARAPGGVAAVFDGNARDLAGSHRLVRRGGALVVFGLSAAATRSWRARLRLVRGLATIARLRAFGRSVRTSVFAIDQLFRRDPAQVQALVAAQVAALAAGVITPVIGAVLPLARAAEAHALLERGAVAGKIVLAT